MTVIRADFDNPEHMQQIIRMTNMYASDPMAAGEPLAPDILERLPQALRAHPGTVSFLALDEGEAVGIANCVRSFSTFKAADVINIHDLAVVPEYRGKRVGKLLLEAVEAEAHRTGCCRVTLEVYGSNDRARKVYAAAGFEGTGGEGDPVTYFYTKPL